MEEALQVDQPVATLAELLVEERLAAHQAVRRAPAAANQAPVFPERRTPRAV